MSKVNLNKLLKIAKENGEAIPAFNIDNLESAIAVTEVMKETGRGVIIQTIPRTLNYGGISTYPAMVDALMENTKIDYCIHLDHGNGLELASKCISSGFSSVMFDGSALDFEDNILKTKEIKDTIPNDISLEAELGAIGGKEQTESEIKYTDPEEAKEFVKLTKCDALAIGVGTAHGVYKGTPVIRTDIIREISKVVDCYLVLHGASGLSDDVVKDCISSGIQKINFATELRQAYTLGIQNGIKNNPNVFDPKIYMRVAIDEIKKTVMKKMSLCLKI